MANGSHSGRNTVVQDHDTTSATLRNMNKDVNIKGASRCTTIDLESDIS